MIETTEIKIFLDDVSRIREEAKSAEKKGRVEEGAIIGAAAGFFPGMFVVGSILFPPAGVVGIVAALSAEFITVGAFGTGLVASGVIGLGGGLYANALNNQNKEEFRKILSEFFTHIQNEDTEQINDVQMYGLLSKSTKLDQLSGLDRKKFFTHLPQSEDVLKIISNNKSLTKNSGHYEILVCKVLRLENEDESKEIFKQLEQNLVPNQNLELVRNELINQATTIAGENSKTAYLPLVKIIENKTANDGSVNMDTWKKLNADTQESLRKLSNMIQNRYNQTTTLQDNFPENFSVDRAKTFQKNLFDIENNLREPHLKYYDLSKTDELNKALLAAIGYQDYYDRNKSKLEQNAKKPCEWVSDFLGKLNQNQIKSLSHGAFKKLLEFSTSTLSNHTLLQKDKVSVLKKMFLQYPLENWSNSNFQEFLSSDALPNIVQSMSDVKDFKTWSHDKLDLLLEKSIQKAFDVNIDNEDRFKLLNAVIKEMPQEMFENGHLLGNQFLQKSALLVQKLLDEGHLSQSSKILDTILDKISRQDLSGLSPVGSDFRKTLSEIINKSISLYNPEITKEQGNVLDVAFKFIEQGKIIERKGLVHKKESNAPFSSHLNKVVDYALENTMNGNGELGNKLLSFAQTSSTNTQQHYLLKGHDVFRGKDKAILYRLLSSPITAQNKENISKMLKRMLPLYDAGHFAEGGTFGVLLPKIVDFIKKNPSEAGFWNVSDLPECDFKKIYIRSFGNLDEMKKKFNLSEPKQSVDKLASSSVVQSPVITNTGQPINISTSSVQRPQGTQIFRSNYNSSNIGRL